MDRNPIDRLRVAPTCSASLLKSRSVVLLRLAPGCTSRTGRNVGIQRVEQEHSRLECARLRRYGFVSAIDSIIDLERNKNPACATHRTDQPG